MTLKTRLHAHLFNTLEYRKTALQLERSQMSMDSTESAKSSAGDKHEVGIAMAQIEIEKLDQQITLAQQQLAVLQKLDPSIPLDQILMGALFEIDQQWYYCSVPFGQIKLDQTTFFCLSPEAPLYQAIKGKKEQQIAVFNGRNWKINKVY
jgi:hypothetical protein